MPTLHETKETMSTAYILEPRASTLNSTDEERYRAFKLFDLITELVSGKAGAPMQICSL